MAGERLWWKLALGVVALYCCGPSQGQSSLPQEGHPTQPPIPRPEVRAFLPATAVLTKELTVDFGDEGGPRTALAYAVPDKRSTHDFQCGVRVLKYKAVSGWAVAYEETDLVINGGGPFDAINIHKVRSSGGKEGVVIVVKYSGAGTATDWHMVAAIGGKFVKLESMPIRDRVLKERSYEFMGYNGVTVKDDLVIEFLPGYSPGRARCCPDKPSLDVVFKFTGSSIKLDSVKELPFTPQN